MKISYFSNNLPQNASLVYPQLLEAIGATDEVVDGNMDADAALIWSVLWSGKMRGNQRAWNHFRSQGKPVIVIEVGGLIRNETWKLGINGINRDADFAVEQYPDDKRLNKLGLMLQPWKHDGEYILVCGQHGDSEQWSNMPGMQEYYTNTIEYIQSHTDTPIVLRNHPRYPVNMQLPAGVTFNMPHHIDGSYDDFDFNDILKHAVCVFSHSSNAGINSIIQGVPAVVSEQSLAWDMGSKSFPHLSKCERHYWLRRISYTEWFADEIDVQWRRLRSRL